MGAKSNIQIRLTGERGGAPLQPDNVGVDYLIRALKLTKELLADVVTEPGELNVIVEAGSLLLKNSFAEPPDGAFTRSMGRFGGTLYLAEVGEHAARALEGFLRLAASHGDSVSIMNGNLPLVEITPGTEFLTNAVQWIEAEIYVRGLVTSAGGKNSPNLHLDIHDERFGKLIVSTSQEQIAGDEKNRLYKEQTLHIRILQDSKSGRYDLSSARLLSYVETQRADDDVSGYLDQLIAGAARSWGKITDKDAWLADIRGYAG